VRIVIAACLLALLAVFGVATVAAQSVEEQSREIAKHLQCPVCNGSTVADSPSDLAAQMRVVIRQKVEAGESREQIIQYFVDRYGDSILVEPPRRGIGLAVWVTPVVILVVGALILWLVLRGWVHARQQTSPMIGPSEPVHQNGVAESDSVSAGTPLDRVRAELDQYRREA